MTYNPTGWMAAYQAERQKRQAQLPILKDALLEELSRHGIAIVIVHYDGEGDSGQTEDIEAFNSTSDTMDLAGPLRRKINDFTWGVLDIYHDGFVNNDGGYGELTIDVAARSVRLDHNDRVIEALSTTTEV